MRSLSDSISKLSSGILILSRLGYECEQHDGRRAFREESSRGRGASEEEKEEEETGGLTGHMDLSA